MLEYSVISALSGIILCFIAGTSLTWTSPEIQYINSTDTGPFDGTLSEEEASWISGVLSIGAAIGPFVFGYLADRIGRKNTILSISIPFAISSIWCAFAKTVTEFYIARFLTGLSVGGTFTILPMYIGELALDEHRGVLGSVFNVFVCFGLLFSYVAGSFLDKVEYFNLLLGGLTGAFFILFFILGCETPQYYLSKKKYNQAEQVIFKIRKTTKDVASKELDQIKNVIEKEERGSILDVFRSKGNRKAFIMGAGLVFFQQVSGINAVLFFAQTIFEATGTSLEPMYCSMIIGAVQFGTSFITPLVSNRFGRKTLLIFSSIGMFLSESLLGIHGIIDKTEHDKISSLNFVPILALVLYIITYNVGFGPLPWAVIGEIFPTSVKSVASALSTSVCWITSFVITKWFTQVKDAVGGQGVCFVGFGVASLTGGVFTHFFVMETRGKSLTEIQEDLNE